MTSGVETPPIISDRITTRQAETHALLLSVMKMIHPIVSPYDLSESNLKANYYNNPVFRNVVERIVQFIESQKK